MTDIPLLNITVIAGPTAVGKSAHAMQLAREKNGIIINADAVQIYDALPILSAQPSMEDQVSVPHALYGILAPYDTTSVQDWVHRATSAIKDSWDKGQHPIVVGGTGMYLNALIEGLSPLPNVSDDVRENARTFQKKLGNPTFHAELQKIDPVMAARLRPSDTQRLIRAYEVITATGVSLATWQDAPRVKPFPQAKITKILIDGPRDTLRTRARKRLDQMIDMGVIDEVDDFRARYPEPTSPNKALGYTAFCTYLSSTCTLEQALDKAFTQTAQYIKRQQTWFRHQITFDQTIMI